MTLNQYLEKWDAVRSGPFFESSKVLAGLPADYLEAATSFGGCEGFLGQQYLRLYRLSELAVLNELYQTSQYNPDLVVFGSDGYGEAFAFDRLSCAVLKIPLIPIPVIGDEIDQIAENFSAFVRRCLTEPQSHRINPQGIGKEVHLKQPLCFGGDWNDESNVILTTPLQHAELARYWNKLYRNLLAEKEGDDR